MTAARNQSIDASTLDVKVSKKTATRVIYVKDHDLTTTGFKTYQHAQWAVSGLPRHVEAPEYRVRIALRSRTNTFDLVVKKRTEVAA